MSKYNQWVSDISDMHQRRAETEARIAKKINHLVLDAVVEGSFISTEERITLLARINRMARILEAEEHTISTLEQVEREVDSIYGDQSENGSYYFGRKSAGEKEIQEMADLTTYDYENPKTSDGFEKDVDFNYEGVQDFLKKADWSDFSMSDPAHYAFEDDGEYIDDGDLLMDEVDDEFEDGLDY